MATVTTTQLIDDISGETAAETITFAVDGDSYEIDLTAIGAKELRAVFATYVEHARKLRKAPAKAAVKGSPKVSSDAPSVREWVRTSGYQGWNPDNRGRIPVKVQEAYEAARGES